MNQETVTVSKEGRVNIPAEIRRAMSISPGDTLSARVVDGELILSTKASLLRRLREVVGTVPDGELVSEQLIQERRKEAAKE